MAGFGEANEEGLTMRAWQWFVWVLFGGRRMPLNEKLRQVITMDRGAF